MSSLLDILHRKDNRAAPEADPPPADVNLAPTVELHLAIDNGPLGTVLDAPPEAAASSTPASAPVFTPSPASSPGDATLVMLSRQQRDRSRRSTLWLGTGLVLIVLGAGVATWLLNGTTDDDSLFTTPADGGSPVSAPVSGPVERPAAMAAPVAPATMPEARQAEPAGFDRTDTTWFDTPAVEDPAPEATAAAAEPVRFVRGTTVNALFSKLTEAWRAFQAADYARAEALWRDVRAADPGNVDALLGLGALAARGGREAEAEEFYQAVLLADPKNAAAISAMSTLPAAASRNLDESALKNALRDQPGAAGLHFALGLMYLAQGRLPDAQVAFFDAVRNEPSNADYAYNLAVSLDQLGQSAPAAAYYQRAVELATASSLFSTGAAAERLATLRSTAP